MFLTRPKLNALPTHIPTEFSHYPRSCTFLLMIPAQRWAVVSPGDKWASRVHFWPWGLWPTDQHLAWLSSLPKALPLASISMTDLAAPLQDEIHCFFQAVSPHLFCRWAGPGPLWSSILPSLVPSSSHCTVMSRPLKRPSCVAPSDTEEQSALQIPNQRLGLLASSWDPSLTCPTAGIKLTENLILIHQVLSCQASWRT